MSITRKLANTFALAALLSTVTTLSQSEEVVNLVLENRSTENVKLLRGNNPGQGNEDGVLKSGESRTVNSVRGRIWSFMIGDKLVATYRTTNDASQQFALTNEMVRGTFPGSKKGKGENAPNAGKENMSSKDTGSKLSAEDVVQFVNIHNAARRKAGVKPLAWSQKLADFAQEQANRIARTGDPSHTKDTPYGENLAFGSGAYTAITAVRDWIAEEQYFKPGEAPRVSGNRVTAHYTQIVWNHTSEVGAGVAVIQSGRYRGWTVVVAVYNPPGNVNNRAPY